MEYSREALDRIAKIKALKEAWVVCYADRFEWKQDISDITKIKELNKSEDLMENWAKWQVKTAWRLVLSRWMWKLLFWKIIDNSWAIQILFKKDSVLFNTWKEIVENIKIDWEEKSAFKVAEKLVQMWDYIWVIWDLFLTKHGELTIFVKEFQILSKALKDLSLEVNL